MNFDSAAETKGLHTSWLKTKVQNTGHGLPSVSSVQVPGNTVEATECFTYLAVTDSSGRSGPEIHRRIGLASSVVGKLSNIWREPKLSLSTKLRLFNVYVVSVLLYGCETWVLLQTDERRLEAFHMSCQRRILDIRWYQFVNNSTVLDQTKEESVIPHPKMVHGSVWSHPSASGTSSSPCCPASGC